MYSTCVLIFYYTIKQWISTFHHLWPGSALGLPRCHTKSNLAKAQIILETENSPYHYISLFTDVRIRITALAINAGEISFAFIKTKILKSS